MANAPGISAFPKTDSNLLEWLATIAGPPDSVFPICDPPNPDFLAIYRSLIQTVAYISSNLSLHCTTCHISHTDVSSQHRYVRQYLPRHSQGRMVCSLQRSNYSFKHTKHACRAKSKKSPECSV